MALAVRVIPCLDVDHGRVVKGVRFQHLIDAGDPVELAARYGEEGADEITFLDVTATVEHRGTIRTVAARTAAQIFIPLTVGGGVRSVDDVAALLASGADKIGINSGAIARPAVLTEIADRFGAQVNVLSLDIAPSADTPSGYAVTTHGGREVTDIDAIDWARRAVDLGAGEMLVNSIAADGTASGFDLPLIERIRAAVTVPVIASGGAGRPSHFVDAARAGADAVLAAGIFHRGEVSIGEVKTALAEAGFPVRIPAAVDGDAR